MENPQLKGMIFSETSIYGSYGIVFFFLGGGEGMLGVDIWISVFIGVSPLSSAPKKSFLCWCHPLVPETSSLVVVFFFGGVLSTKNNKNGNVYNHWNQTPTQHWRCPTCPTLTIHTWGTPSAFPWFSGKTPWSLWLHFLHIFTLKDSKKNVFNMWIAELFFDWIC